MKWLISKILAGVFLLAVLAIGLVFLLVDTSPAIEGVDNSSQEDMVLARSVVQLNNRTVEQDDGITQLQFTTEELQAAAAWLLRDFPGTRISFTSEGDSVKLAFTYGFDLVGREFFLNSEATIIPDRQEPEITGIQFGSLSLNGDLGNTFAGLIYEKARDRVPELAQIEEAVDYVNLQGNTLYIGLRRNEAFEQTLYERGSEYYLQPGLRERMLIQAGRLDQILDSMQDRRTLPVAELMAAMMKQAADSGADPVEENRAIILVLSSYMMRIDLNKVLGLADDSRLTLRRIRLTAANRLDYAQHFLGSAGLTLSAGNEMAQLLALAKEIDDTSSGGSGFSFTDLGADRAGSNFAELAVANSEQALFIQQRLGQSPGESWFLPDLNGLPEYMTDQEMQERFGGVEGPQFKSVMQDLEARLSRIPMTLELQAL